MIAIYQILEIPWDTLSEDGILFPAVILLLALALLGVAIDAAAGLFRRHRSLKISGGLSGLLTRRKVDALRARGQLQGAFTFADAVELTQTGTIRAQALEDKIVDCVVPIEMLFMDDDHGLYYQFEMEEWTEGDVASWVEVTKALNLAELSTIMEEVMLMYGIIRHPEYEPEIKDGDEEIGEKLWKRAAKLRSRIVEIDGIAQLRAASEAHLRRNAPDMLPLPVWSSRSIASSPRS